MDAIALLKADHRAVEELFEKFEKARDDGRKKELATTICHELIVHTIIEEEIFYPAVRGKVEDDLLDESYVEHDGAKMLIAEILAGSPGDDFFDAKVTVLKEQIEHHVKEEEKPGEGLFAQARHAAEKAASKKKAAEKDEAVDLDELGAAMQARKEELMQTIAEEGADMLQTRSFHAGAPAQGEPPAARAPLEPGFA
ncbi:MAG: hemerythrin domain-containing protein [Rhodospirillales bacterium]|nr:hemerythrin domain-containing protein [Rhodospirillales bacterium]